MAAATVPVPRALASGGGGTVWNPAQRPPAGEASLSLDIVQTPTAVGANGALFVGRIRVRRLGEVGLVYGEMAMSDLLRTTLTPEPDGGTIPYFAHHAGVNWTLTRRGATVGTTVGLDDARLDGVHEDRARFDIGITQLLPAGVRIAAAGHLVSRLRAGEAGHDLYAGLEWCVWHGAAWNGSGPGSFVLRSGVATGRGVSSDYQVGLGLDVARQFAADLQLTRRGGYPAGSWSGSAGVQVRIGRYRVRYARDTGLSDLGSAYRVGLEAQVK